MTVGRRGSESGEALRERILRAGAWVGGMRMVGRGLRLLRTVVLARLLAPEDFGRFGIALLVVAGVDILSKTGFRPALVQRRGDLGPYLDTAWTLELLRGVLLAALLLSVAGPAAVFFEEPGAAPLLRALAAVALLRGAQSMGLVLLERRLDFRRRVLHDLAGAGAEVVAAVSAALVLGDARALVIGLLAAEVARLGVSYRLHPWRPRFRLDWRRGLELYRFGRWVFAAGGLTFLATQGDDMVLAKLLGAAALGYYQMAYRIANLITTEITHAVSQVMFPAYATLQEEPGRLGIAFARVLDAVAAAAAPVAILFVLRSEGLIVALLGETWRPMVPAFRILTVAGLLRAVLATAGPVYQAVGRPDLDFWTNLLRFGVLAVVVVPLTARWGLVGAAWSVVAAVTVPFLLWRTHLFGLLDASPWRMLRGLSPTALSGALMAGVLLLPVWPPGIVGEGGALVAAAAGYAGTQLLLWRVGAGGEEDGWRTLLFSRLFGYGPRPGSVE